MRVRSIKYASPLIIYAGSVYAFLNNGWAIFIPLILVWVIVPLAELFIPPDGKNLDAAEAELASKDRLYDYWLYLIVPLQYIALLIFLQSMRDTNLRSWEIIGRIFVMGLLCGTLGINVAHELGHRHKKFEQSLAKTLLLTSLYMHFFIEHNKGHHKNVSTPEDPSSARYGESVYTFYFRTVVYAYLSAWKISRLELRRRGLSFFDAKNEMLIFHLIQFSFVFTIFLLFGTLITFYFLAAATIGFLLLETVNYIEHYGLQRKKTGPQQYQRTMPEHSWNSNHLLGRIILFELSRHSDHHYMASRKYQLLRHHDQAPQMPTGYPGMMILSLIPPAWFYIMNQRIRNLSTETGKKNM
jgi:alkane 1-monooxygenase